ncbi:MAG: aspartyl-tRNA(Asn)/glutamyl-tRNA(Gln) amidotransferase subunit B [Gammaproteobacteria bacterium]|jgi:aspartyl-tRNA(Asn)/glutamyl-tRNA(Gln) amidotransferase subunit B
MSWESVIGLEIHAQLATKSKIFSGAATAYGASPNSQACAVDLGLPGVLPVLNAQAVQMAVMFGLAVEAQIARRCVFARKNYFYPDLPKGYQISQLDLPIVIGGHVMIDADEDDSPLRIELTRAHLEEDAGKSVHGAFQGLTGVDLNRAGTPLLEIVSEPDMRTAKQAVAYMRKVHSIVRYLGVCDGNMQEGSFRCDANVSIRRSGDTKLGTRTELKNLNSFRYIERAIDFEIERQIDILESGATIHQETRLYDPDRHETRSMRSKEEANDYRYFPDPDLLPVEIDNTFIDSVRANLPELADVKRKRFERDYGLSAQQARFLTDSRELADYFEATLSAGGPSKTVANWIMGELSAAMNRNQIGFSQIPVSPAALANIVAHVEDGTLSTAMAKQVFEAVWDRQGEPEDIISARGLRQVTDSHAIETLVETVIAANPTQIEQFHAGKEKVLGYLVGQVMKASAGKANAKQVNALMRDKLAQ